MLPVLAPMLSTTALVIIIAVAALLAIGGGVALVGSRRRQLPPSAPPQVDPGAQQPGRAGDTDTEGGDRGGVATLPEGPVTVDETAEPGVDELVEPETPAREEVAPVRGRLARLRARLARSQSSLGKGLLALLSSDKIDEDTWTDIEDTLLIADVGVGPTQELVEQLRTRVRVDGIGPEEAQKVLRDELIALVDPTMDRSLNVDRHDGVPGVLMVVGVNGTGKTTTVGKLARVLVAEDKDVVLGAADTFRAAASEQLTTWGERVGVPTVRGAEGADPASVAFDAVKAGVEGEADAVVIDTAGRLHTKVGLMDELGKVKRVIEKAAPVTEVLLVIDATTGQNGLIQAKVFSEVINVTGVVLTKLDGTAKGGIVIAVQRELGVPVKLVGLGEGADDLAPFEAEEFVDALLA